MAQDFVGWHTNTGKKESLVAFAPVGAYQQKYLEKGLLDRLFNDRKQGVVPPADPKLMVNVGSEILTATKARVDGVQVIQPTERRLPRQGGRHAAGQG